MRLKFAAFSYLRFYVEGTACIPSHANIAIHFHSYRFLRCCRCRRAQKKSNLQTFLPALTDSESGIPRPEPCAALRLRTVSTWKATYFCRATVGLPHDINATSCTVALLLITRSVGVSQNPRHTARLLWRTPCLCPGFFLFPSVWLPGS